MSKTIIQNVPVDNYTIVYTDSFSGNVCHTANINKNRSCTEKKTYKYDYNLSLSSCIYQTESDVIVSALATNIFGSGSPINATVGKCLHVNNFIIIIA